MRSLLLGSRRRTDKPVTILQVLPRLLPGGVERDAIGVAGAVADAGGTSLVATAGGPLITEVYRVGARPVFLPLDQVGTLMRYQNVGRLLRALQKEHVDLVHLHSRLSGWSVMTAAQRAGCSLVTGLNSHYVGDGDSGRRPTAVTAAGDRILAVSDFAAEQFAGAFPAAIERLRIVDRGIDLQRFDPEKVTAERMVRLARQWRLVDGRPLVLMPARFLPFKGHRLLLEAASLLGERDFHCLLLGFDVDGPAYRREIEALIGRMGLYERVHVATDCNDMPAAYMLADVVVSAATQPEAFARIVVEAQAMGRPVVAPAHGDALHQAGHGKMAWLVPPNEPAPLARAIAEGLALSPQERRILAPHAIALVRARFSQHLMRRQTLQVYDELLKSRQPARGRSGDPTALVSSP